MPPRTEPGFHLGRVFGIDIRIDWSLALIFMLIAVNLGVGLFPAQHPAWPPLLIWGLALLAAALFFLSVLAHELAHGIVGRRLGVPIEGITLFMFGGVARMRGEPRSPRAEFLMAVVGPLTSLVIGVGAIALGLVLAPGRLDEVAAGVFVRGLNPVATMLLWLGPINVLLAVFNLLPGFPLDGGRVLRAILWRLTGDLHKATAWASGVGRAIALGLVFLGILMMFGRRIPVLGQGFGQGLWLMLIGWFLHTAALQSYAQLRVREALRDMTVTRLMRRDLAPIGPIAPLSDLADRFLASGDERCLPVSDGDKLVGIVCVGDLRKVPRPEWPSRPVRDVMTPIDRVTTLSPDEDLAEAIPKLAQGELDQLPVVRGGRVEGILRRSDVMRWMEVFARA
jgi:Zn-dependent protease/CBS domain-containing protein